MQTLSDKSSAVGTDLLPVLAGAAAAVSGGGITLTLIDAHAPLRAPFAPFSLFAGLACALTALPLLRAAARRVRNATPNGRPTGSRLIVSDNGSSEFDHSVLDSIPNSVSKK